MRRCDVSIMGAQTAMTYFIMLLSPLLTSWLLVSNWTVRLYKKENILDLVLGIDKHHENLASTLVCLLTVTVFSSILHANFHIAKWTMSASINAWPSQSRRCPLFLNYTSTLKKLTALFLPCFHIHFCLYVLVNGLILFSPHKLISNPRTMTPQA